MSSHRIIPALKSKSVAKRRVVVAGGGGPVAHQGSFILTSLTDANQVGAKVTSSSISAEITTEFARLPTVSKTVNIYGEITTNLPPIISLKSSNGNSILTIGTNILISTNVLRTSSVLSTSLFHLDTLAKANKTSAYEISDVTNVQFLGKINSLGNITLSDTTEIIIIGTKNLFGNLIFSKNTNMGFLAVPSRYGNISSEVATNNQFFARVVRQGILSSESVSDLIIATDLSTTKLGNMDLQAVFNFLITPTVIKTSAFQSSDQTNFAILGSKNNQASLDITDSFNISSSPTKAISGRVASETLFNNNLLGGLSFINSINAAITTNSKINGMKNSNGVLDLGIITDQASAGKVVHYGLVSIEGRIFLETTVLIEGGSENTTDIFKTVYFDISLLDSYSAQLPLHNTMSISTR